MPRAARLAEVLFVLRKVAERFAGLERFLGKCRRSFVADKRIQAGDHRETFLHAGFAILPIGFHICRHRGRQSLRRTCQQRDAFQRGLSHDGHHDIQLKLPAGRAADMRSSDRSPLPGRQLASCFRTSPD